MATDRDIAVFEGRAITYDGGWLGRLHHDIADRTADIASSDQRAYQRVLDVGCGTGYLLWSLGRRWPDASALVGVDASPAMVDVATKGTDDGRLHCSVGLAEQLPFTDGTFDLVVSTTSFDHWSDQGAGLRECKRVLVPGGRLVLADLFSTWLRPTLLKGRSSKARTRRRCDRLLAESGFGAIEWHGGYPMIIKGVTGTA